MIITNNYNLPANLVRAVEYDAHRKADYSCSELIKAPRIVHLEKRHDDEIRDDASERVWLLLGRSVHYILEKSATKSQLEESYIEIPVCDRMISGTSDLYEDKKVSDYKVTSAWSLIYGDRIKNWENQLNVYAYMFRTIGLEVEELQIVAILRDWIKSKAENDQNYPQKPVIPFSVPLWYQNVQEEYIKSRVANLITYEDASDKALPHCTPEDRWEKPTRYAVMKEGRKSALRVFDTEDDAVNFIEPNSKQYLEVRQGESTRCERFCLVRQWCNQYKSMKQSEVSHE